LAKQLHYKVILILEKASPPGSGRDFISLRRIVSDGVLADLAGSPK
jgi:hypothetical protein